MQLVVVLYRTQSKKGFDCFALLRIRSGRERRIVNHDSGRIRHAPKVGRECAHPTRVCVGRWTGLERGSHVWVGVGPQGSGPNGSPVLVVCDVLWVIIHSGIIIRRLGA